MTGSPDNDQQRHIRRLMSTSLRALPQASAPLSIEAVELHQAIGVVMECATVNAATALHRLCVYAHHSHRPMRNVVAEVRTGHLPFDPTTPVSRPAIDLVGRIALRDDSPESEPEPNNLSLNSRN